MTLSICQICGQCLCQSDLSSDPLQHFCIGLDGPAMIDSHDFLPRSLDSDSEAEDSRIIIKKPTTKPAVLPVQHNPDDVKEIGRLHIELEELRRAMGKNAPVATKVKAVKA